MSKPRKQFSPALKAKVAIEAIKGEKTPTAIGKMYSIHPNLVGIWKRQALEGLPGLFAGPRPRAGSGEDPEKTSYFAKSAS